MGFLAEVRGAEGGACWREAASLIATWETCPRRRFFSGPAGDPGVIPTMAHARREADAIGIPELPALSEFRLASTTDYRYHLVVRLGREAAG